MNFESMLSEEENDSLERKSSISDLSGIGHTARAFANQSIGGFFIIGIDKNGEVSGIQKTSNPQSPNLQHQKNQTNPKNHNLHGNMNSTEPQTTQCF